MFSYLIPVIAMLMNKEVNCSNFRGLFDYLRKHYGSKGILQVTEGLVDNNKYLVTDKVNPSKHVLIQKHHLLDSAYWVSYEFTLHLFTNAKHIVGGSNNLIKAGEKATIDHFSKSSLFLGRIFSPKFVCKQAPKVNARFNRTKTVKITELTNNSATFELHYYPNFQAAKDICNWNLGIYTGLAKVTGIKHAKCEEIKCSAEGADCCVFLLTWEKGPNVFKQMLRWILKKISKDLITDYEIMVNERDQLIDTLKQSEETLQKARDELEIHVQHRTAELSAANEQLTIEIEERKRAELQTRSSLKEKEILLREVHHRVKNNFEIISSLLGMSDTTKENWETKRLLENARNRIYSMAIIHSQLYENERFDQIIMERYIRDLMEHLFYVYAGNERWISPVIYASEVHLSINQAIPCALILNELISNTFKHAFNEKESGTVWVSINTSEDGTVSLKVKDNGSGIPEGLDLDKADGIGLRLARNLVVGQLNGDMCVKGDDGTEIRVEFKKWK